MNSIAVVDTDGDVTKLVPWLQSVGVEGVLPLERQAGGDGMGVRGLDSPLGRVVQYNKRVMHLGEAAMRKECERMGPLMRTGGFLPSVDHQTPPEVSLDDYRLFLRLLEEYTAL